MFEKLLCSVFLLGSFLAILWIFSSLFMEVFSKKSKTSNEDVLIEFSNLSFSFFYWVILFGTFFAGIGIIIYQIYIYLKFGEWNPISLISGLNYIGFEWAKNPNEWLGLHKILDKLPLSISTIILSSFIFHSKD